MYTNNNSAKLNIRVYREERYKIFAHTNEKINNRMNLYVQREECERRTV